MSSRKIGRWMAVGAALLTGALAAMPASAVTLEPRPRVFTGKASYVLTSSALLTAVVNPNGVPTSYYFRYGPTAAYGSQTPTVSVGSGVTKVKVGQPVSGLQQGVVYH